MLVVASGAVLLSRQAGERLPLPVVEVDRRIRPSQPSLAGDPARPLAAIAGDRGPAIDFVENELLLTSPSQAAVDAFVARWDGVVLDRTDPADYGIEELEPQYRVRVRVAAAPISDLPERLRELDPLARGRFGVSSGTGLRLLAAATEESLRGNDVALNLVGVRSGYRQRRTKDAPGGAGRWSDNAFDWVHMRTGGPQDMGVAEAWRMLDRAGKLGNRVPVAVLDGGFWEGANLARGWQERARSAEPSRAALGPNETAKTWHGSLVAETLAAVPDDGVGAAGSGGPVVDVIPVYTGEDLASANRALWIAAGAGARIITMSIVWPAPALSTGSVSLLNRTTEFLRRSGVLLFGSAGNGGNDVDAEDCLVKCWEETWYTPCENGGVICVGGLGSGSTRRDPASNYGREEVEIFGPFEVYVGPDPGRRANQSYVARGTTVATPFVAGVAALIWAADPKRKADEVEDILLRTVHRSPDPVVPGYVDARIAMKHALGNTPPVLEIVAPKGGSTVGYGGINEVTLVAEVDDDEDAERCCDVAWTSNVEGPLGSGRSLTVGFDTPGERLVTAVATDSRGATSAPQRIRLKVRNTPPSVRIAEPKADATVFLGAPTPFRAVVIDPNQAKVGCAGVEWFSSKSSDVVTGTGCSTLLTFHATGMREVVAAATDERGAAGEATLTVRVVRPPSQSPPIVAIVRPDDGATVRPEGPVELEASAYDPDRAGGLSFRWSVIVEGATRTIGTTKTLRWTPRDDVPFDCGGADATLRFEATDADGVGQAQIDVTVAYPPC